MNTLLTTSEYYNQKEAVARYLSKKLDSKFCKSVNMLIKGDTDNKKLNSAREYVASHGKKEKYQGFLSYCAMLMAKLKEEEKNLLTNKEKNNYVKIEMISRLSAKISEYNFDDEKFGFLSPEDKKAVKYMQNLVKNDTVRLTKYTDNVTFNTYNVNDIYSCAINSKEFNCQYDIKLKEGETVKSRIDAYAARLKATDSKLHKNSQAYKELIGSIEVLQKIVPDKTELDKNDKEKMLHYTQGLYNAVQGYINAKGLGKKSTDLGNERIDIAMEMNDFLKGFEKELIPDFEAKQQQTIGELKEKNKELLNYEFSEELKDDMLKSHVNYQAKPVKEEEGLEKIEEDMEIY